MSTKPILNDVFPFRPDDDIQNSSKTPVVLRHAQWEKILGTAQISVGNVGYHKDNRGRSVRHPLGIATDPLAMRLDANGAPLPHAGLMSLDAPEYQPFCQVVDYFVDRGYLMLVPFDHHADYEHDLNLDADTITLTPEFIDQLDSEDRLKAESHFSSNIRDGQPLTAAEWKYLFGNPVDGEFRDHGFFVHCLSGAPFTPHMESHFAALRSKIKGLEVPDVRLIPLMKTTLFGDVAPDIRGLHGNHYDAIIRASQAGMPQGVKYYNQRQAIQVGAALGYSATLEAYHLFCRGMRTHIMAGATFVIPGAMSKFELIRALRLFLPNAITASYFWPEALLGPAPKGYNDRAAQVRDSDKAHLRQTEASRFTNDVGGIKIIEDWGN
ncbi:hypothetical protein A2368_00890 [Candidatus Collierbacteria bacterium RIFOXYB1_FULL_49_13]|uniref:Uncharacterized protein n=1 Tax=Candidatus Collierbacteria bacterium RIFOXYB1_FULL_49_13 TaxID=1817728 RepID=A0A1F5FHL3_9BACT|nr:MAG: hypothetical protein A2368_00890 [Candidatus Collierbacteria bacterium RIFOXYB1_FULL_49_13]